MADNEQLCSVLAEFAGNLLTEFPLQAILDHLVVRVVEVLPVTGAGVTLIAIGQNPHLLAASSAAALRFEQLQSEIGQGPCVAAHHTREAVAVPDLDVDPRFPEFAPQAVAAGLRAVFALPLRHEHGCLGALDLYCDSPGPLNQADLDVAQTLADVATSYLVNAQSRDEVTAARDRFLHSSLHDPLTQLPNRRLLQERLEQAARRARRSATTAAVLFVDLDRFKAVNDTYGHRSGDSLLCAVARRLEGLVRPSDTLARIAGDEFVFLCEDLGSNRDAERIATRVRAAFTEPFHLEGSDVALGISASIGISCAGPDEPITELLVERADQAMYEVKSTRQDGALEVSQRASVELVPHDPTSSLEGSDRARAALADVRTTACGGIFFTRHEPAGARLVSRISFTFPTESASLGGIKERMADEARDIGADAIINFRYGHQPASWWRSHLGRGRAVGSWYGEGDAVTW